MRTLPQEVYEALNNLNPIFMTDYFIPKKKTMLFSYDTENYLMIPEIRTTNYIESNHVFLKGLKIGNSTLYPCI